MSLDFSFPTKIRGLFSTMGPVDVFEIIVVAVIFYKIYQLLEDTRALSLFKGFLVLLGVTALSTALNLHVISWMLQKTLGILIVALPIVFQPELRRTLERLGQGRFFRNGGSLTDEDDAKSVIDEIVKAAKYFSATKTGALMVIERKTGLNDICRTGIHVDALITSELLGNVFFVNTPLHDGAIVIRGKRLISAGCLLPLTENRQLSTELGTRHRAAIGLSEQCDALIVVVSEETGTISVAEDGHITRHLTGDALAEILRPAFSEKNAHTIKELGNLFTKWRGDK